jgi:hypothetical protein
LAELFVEELENTFLVSALGELAASVFLGAPFEPR